MAYPTICQSAPERPKSEILRDNILDTLESQFDGDTQVIIVEGVEGIGKTTLLSQFAMRHQQHVLCLFASSASTWAYDPLALRFDLSNQLEFLLYGTELADASVIDESFLRFRFLELQRRARRRNETFFFVIDGLEEIPEEDDTSRRLILALLPFGWSGFRFLLSGNVQSLELSTRVAERTKPHQLSFFSLNETERLFDGVTATFEQAAEFHRITRGTPGYLASIRRLIERGMLAEELLKELPERLPRIFDVEWRAVDAGNERLLFLLAVLAHDRRRYSVVELAAVTHVDVSTVEALLSQLTFVVADKEVKFVTEAFRRYAARRLADWKGRVSDALIDYFLDQPESDEALALLPGYFHDAKRFQDLVSYLSPENFVRLLRRSPSLKLVQQKADLGIEAAKYLGRDADLVRFTLQRSTIEDIASSEVGRSEVRAIASLGEYDKAYALAQSSVRNEDRLRLLAAVARARREAGLPADPELDLQIRQAYADVEPSVIGRRSMPIAADLMYSYPDLAVEIVEKSRGQGGENALDWALVTLAMQAGSSAPLLRDRLQTVSTRLRDPEAKRFSAQATLVLGDFTAEEAIAEAQRLEHVSDQLYVLRNWSVANRTREDATLVFEYAIKRSIQTTGYAPNALVFRQLAAPLPYTKDIQKVTYFLSVLDSQLGALQALGPTEDFVRLRLIMARAEWSFDRKSAATRLLDVYLYIDAIPDVITKTTCIARLVATLTRLPAEERVEDVDSLKSLAEGDLENSVTALLNLTAEHEEAVTGVVKALASARPELALSIVNRVNIERSRDEVFAELIDAALEAPRSELNWSAIGTALDSIRDRRKYTDALISVITNLSRRKFAGAVPEEALELLARAHDIDGAAPRCHASSLALRILSGNKEESAATDLRSALTDTLFSAWEAVDTDWLKVSVGYDVVSELANSLPLLARDIFNRVAGLKHQYSLYDESTMSAATLALSLSIRAFGGLVAKSVDTPDDGERIGRAIAAISALGAQASLWADLALRYHSHGRTKECADLVKQKLVPLLDSISPQNIQRRRDGLTACAAALYSANPITGTEAILALPSVQRDEAIGNVCEYLLTRTLPDEPYETAARLGYDIDFDRAVEIIHLLHHTERDGQIYYFVKAIVDSVVHSRFRDNFSASQKGEIARLLVELAERKLPNPRNIQHEGFKIVTLLEVNRLGSTAATRPLSSLIAAARAIPNVPDRAYVLAIIAASDRDPKRRKELLDESSQIVSSLPMMLDKIDHLEIVGTLLFDVDAPLAKEYLRQAMQCALQAKGDDLAERRRSLIDTAYRQAGSEYAAALASMISDDPATSKIDKQLRLIELRKSLAEGGSNETSEHFDKSRAVDVARVAWQQLGALNSGRTSALPVSRTIGRLEYASAQPLTIAYPLYAWFIENAVRRLGRPEDMRQIVLPFFQACLLDAELAIRAAERSAVSSRRTFDLLAEVSRRAEDGSLTIREGEREKAIEFVKQWLSTNLGKYLKISDPYFGPNDLEILKLVLSVRRDCEVIVLTSRANHARAVSAPWDDAYATAWVKISEEDPPPTRILIIGTRASGKSPIHDRWWISEEAALEIGTSWNGIGKSGTTLRPIPSDEARIKESYADDFITQSRREFDGDRITYNLITL